MQRMQCRVVISSYLLLRTAWISSCWGHRSSMILALTNWVSFGIGNNFLCQLMDYRKHLLQITSLSQRASPGHSIVCMRCIVPRTQCTGTPHVSRSDWALHLALLDIIKDGLSKLDRFDRTFRRTAEAFLCTKWHTTRWHASRGSTYCSTIEPARERT